MKLKFSWLFICIFMLTVGNSCVSTVKKPKSIDKTKTGRIINTGDNVYYCKTGYNFYIVDVQSQLCFYQVVRSGGAGGVTQIDCKNLAKRPEWKPFITWVDNE